MFNDSFEANPECDIFGEPHVGYEKTHNVLSRAYERLQEQNAINQAAMALLNSGVYWTPELLRRNATSERAMVFAVATTTLERIGMEG
jgi:hypothetical protein